MHAGAGHSMYNPGIQHELLQATERMRVTSMRDITIDVARESDGSQEANS